MANTSRLFFALWPDDKTRGALAGLCQAISAKGFKWVRPDNLHVTLVFLGGVDKETGVLLGKSVAEVAAQAFTLTFDRLSYWSKPKVLCLTTPQPAQDGFMDEKGAMAGAKMLVGSLTAVAAQLGLPTDPRPYIPHITLARHALYLPKVEVEPIVWQADAFCLMESCSGPDGVRYNVLQQWPLLKPAASFG